MKLSKAFNEIPTAPKKMQSVFNYARKQGWSDHNVKQSQKLGMPKASYNGGE